MPDGEHEEFTEFIKTSREFQQKTTLVLGEIRSSLKQIPVLDGKVTKIEDKLIKLELDEKDKVINGMEKRIKDKNEVFKAIRDIESDYKAFKNRLIGYAIGSGIVTGAGVSGLLKLIG